MVRADAVAHTDIMVMLNINLYFRKSSRITDIKRQIDQEIEEPVFQAKLKVSPNLAPRDVPGNKNIF